jgi:hypothetical protein
MKVLSQIIKFSKELLALKSQVHTNTLQIKEIREDLAQSTSIVKDLKHEIELHQLKQTNELENQRLQIENILLRHFRHPSSQDNPFMLPPNE